MKNLLTTLLGTCCMIGLGTSAAAHRPSNLAGWVGGGFYGEDE